MWWHSSDPSYRKNIYFMEVTNEFSSVNLYDIVNVSRNFQIQPYLIWNPPTTIISLHTRLWILKIYRHISRKLWKWNPLTCCDTKRQNFLLKMKEKIVLENTHGIKYGYLSVRLRKEISNTPVFPILKIIIIMHKLVFYIL